MKRIRMVYRPALTIFAILLLTVGSVIGISSMVAASQAQTEAAAATLATMGELSDNNDALRDQLLSLDIKPVAPAAAAIVNQTGATGAAGQRGLPGIDGTDGIDGTNGTNGVNGIDGVPGLSGSDGGGGANGSNGSDGASGLDGASGPAGADGAAGANGANGANGADGADAEPVVSWTYPVGGVPYTCDRTTSFDPSAPTYECAPTPASN